jgi:hypothetical protein
MGNDEMVAGSFHAHAAVRLSLWHDRLTELDDVIARFVRQKTGIEVDVHRRDFTSSAPEWAELRDNRPAIVKEPKVNF